MYDAVQLFIIARAILALQATQFLAGYILNELATERAATEIHLSRHLNRRSKEERKLRDKLVCCKKPEENSKFYCLFKIS